MPRTSPLPEHDFQKLVLSKLNQIEQRLQPFEKIADEFLTPKEICKILKISRGKLEQMVGDGLVKLYKLDPNGRKLYARRSDLESLFPKDFAELPVQV